MTSRTVTVVAFALLAAVAATFFLALSIDREIYAPGIGKIEWRFGLGDTIGAHVAGVYDRGFSIMRIFRKIYSIGAFTVVGFLLTPIFPQRARFLSSVLAVTTFSLAIEVAQRAVAHISKESNLSSLFDLGCGAIGGALGALLWVGISNVVRGRVSDKS